MSISIMSEIFKRYTQGGNEMLLALALADHAHDDGTHIFPSVGMLANKIRVSRRTVQYLLKKMQSEGWLILVKDPNGGRSKTRHYHIDESWIKGENVALFSEKRANPRTQTVKISTQKGAIVAAPKPSITFKEPSSNVINQDRSIIYDPIEKIFVGISEDLMKWWSNAYKPIDVESALLKMEAWYDAHPNRRKKNIARFITNWLNREQNKRLGYALPIGSVR